MGIRNFVSDLGRRRRILKTEVFEDGVCWTREWSTTEWQRRAIDVSVTELTLYTRCISENSVMMSDWFNIPNFKGQKDLRFEPCHSYALEVMLLRPFEVVVGGRKWILKWTSSGWRGWGKRWKASIYLAWKHQPGFLSIDSRKYLHYMWV